MKNASQAPGLLRSRSLSFLFMLVTYCSLLLMPGWARGQTKVIANEVTYTSGNKPFLLGCGGFLLPECEPTVENPTNATLANNNYARLLASPGVAATLGSYKGEIELKFPAELPANTWSYVRINGNTDLFGALLGGNLGKVLGGVLGAVLIGNQEIDFEARLGTSSVLSGSSTEGFGTDRVKMLTDEQGNYYLAIRPSGKYDRIRITNKTGSLLGLGTVKTLDVYNAFYYEDNDKDCGRPFFTSFDGSSTGLTLDVLPIDNGTIKYAIDADPNTFTTLKASSVLGLNVAGSISQNFYFSTTTDETSTANIKLALGSSGLLDLRVLSGIDIIFKNNGQTVATKSLSSGLLAGTNLLGLLQNGQPVTLTFGLGAKFDQIEIRSSALVGLSLAAPDIKIYDVQRYDGVTCVNPNIVTPTPTSPMLSQKNCAAGLIAHQHANFPTNTVDGNNDSYTTLEASSGIAVGIGAYNGFVEMGFATPVAAGKTTYVRIDFDNEVLGGLLNGSVGGLLNGTVSTVLFGNHYFTIEGKSDGAVVYSRSSNDGLSSIGKVGAGGARIVQDKNGHYYIAITPDVAINSVRITENLGALVGLGTVKTMNVYHACHATGAEPCEQGFATFSESSGVTLDLLGLGGAGVTDAQNAIDLGSDGKTNLNTASKISVGAVGIAGTMMQHVQFHGLSTDRDHFRVKMKMQNNGAVSANVLGSIIVKAYDGEQEVYSQRLNERLIPGLDLLNLLSSGQMVNLPFAPGKPFDRVAVGIASLVDANIISVPLEIYSVERFSQACPDPELKWDPKTTPPFNTPACVGEVTSFENVNFPYEAITDNPSADTYATLTAGAGVAAGLGSYSSHIELKYSDVGAAAHEVSYIRVDAEGNLFKALLGGSLGNALGNVLGSVALGNQYIVVQAKDAVGNPVGTAHSSVTGFNNEFVKLVKDKDGKFYLAVTAPGAYQSVRIEYHHTALVGGMGSSSMKLYSMCRETEFDVCEQATFTSWDGNGIALDILDLTKGGVANPEFAIDADNSNYSTLNLGVVGVAASVSQKVYFKTKSDISDELRVRLQLANPGILNLDLFGNTKLIFYNGEQNVKEMTLASGLINNIDLLGLFNSGGVQSFTFAPGVEYDRVELKIASLVGVNTSAPILLYGMSRITAGCPDPDFLSPSEVFKSPVCADGVELGNVRAVDDITNAVDGDYNTYANMRSDAGAIFGIGNKESIIELKYGAAVGANTTSYLRIGDDAGILESLLSGSIGEAVYGLLNNVALGDNYFVVRAKNGANTVLEGSSRNGFAGANGKMKIVQDKAGRYYVAISPSADYTSVEIKAFSESLVGLLAKGYNLHVYGMCHETDFSGCQEGFSTSWDGSGLSVGVTGVGGYGVKDAFKALNNNNNGDFSTLSLGTLNVAGHIQQNIQYTNTVAANTPFRLKMAVGTGTVNVSVFDDIRIIGYKDGSIVYNQNLQTAVLGGVSLGTLFNNGGAHDVDFAMDQEVDEIALRLNSLVNATVGVPDVRLYYIVQDCKAPMVTSWKSFKVDNDENIKTVKGGEKVEYTIHVRNTGSVALNDYIVTDAIPANTTYVAGSGGTFANGAVTFTGIDVAAGATATVSFTVTVNPDLTGVTKISNVALVKKDATDPGTETFPPSPTNPNEPKTGEDKGTDIPVEQISSISTWKAAVAKSVGATVTSVSGGETIDYTIYIKNTGNQALTGVQVTEALPVGTTLASGSSLTFAPLDIAVGGEKSVTFQVTVNNDLTGITNISNVATVTIPGKTPVKTTPADPTNPTVGPDPTKDPGDPTEIPVGDEFALVSWKTAIVNGDAAITSVKGGETIEYTIYVRNTGNKDLTNVVINDPLPAGTTLVSGSLPFTITTLKVGATSIGYTFKVKVNQNLTNVSEIKNIAKVTTTEITTEQESYPSQVGNPNEPDVTKPAGTVTSVTPVNNIDLTLAGVSNGAVSSMAASDDQITYTVTVTNTGNQDLVALDLATTIPANTTSVNNGVFTANGTNLTFTIPTLEVGQTATYSFVVKVGTIDNVTVPSIDNSVKASNTVVSDTKTHTMLTNCTPVVAGNLTLTSSVSSVCIGGSITLEGAVSGVAGVDPSMIKWYRAYNETTEAVSGSLGAGASVVVTPTGVGTITYYAVVEGAGVCFDNPPAKISIIVNALPATPTITPSSATVCEGEQVTLTATGGETYVWSKVGEATPLAETTGTLTLLGALSDVGKYTVRAVNGDGCTSDASTAMEVVVNQKPIASITPSSSSICAGENIILTSNSATNNKWYRDGVLLLDEAGNTLTAETIAVNKSGSYTLVIVDAVTGCESLPSVPTVITVNPLPVITLNGEAQMTVALGSSVALPTISNPDADVTYTWYDEKGKVIDPLLPVTFNSAGVYTYTIVANNNVSGCMASTTVIITVFDSNGCPPIYKRHYASSQKWVSTLPGLNGVTDAGNAVDGNPRTYSKLYVTAVALGLGTTYQDLKFDAKVDKGTPVTIKVGPGGGLLGLGDGLSIVGRRNGSDIGVIQPVGGKLLSLIDGESSYEYTFVPANSSGPQDYDEVRIIYGALLSAAKTFNIYGAYINEPVSQLDCNQPEIIDILSGTHDLGLAALTATVGVRDAWNVVDSDSTNYAQLYSGVGVLAEAQLTATFRSVSLPGDRLEIKVSNPNQILQLSLLNAMTVQRYQGITPVGPALSSNGNLLKLVLLSGNNDGRIIVDPQDDLPYDRVKISLSGAVNVLDFLNVHYIKRTPKIEITNPVVDGKIELCPSESLNLTIPQSCVTYEVSYNGQLLDPIQGTPGGFKLPSGLTAGEYTLLVQQKRYGCNFGEPQEVLLTLLPSPVSTVKLNDVEQTTITLAPYDKLKVEVTTDATTTIAKWEINENGTWDDYAIAGTGNTFTYAVPLKPAGSQVKFRALLASDKGCDAYTGEIVLNIKAQEVDYDNSRLVVKKGKAVANGSDMNAIEAQIRDKFDMPIAGITVAYTVSGLPEAQPSALTGTSDANGQFELTLTSEKIGTASITATAGGTAITVGSPALVTFVAGAIDFNLSNIEVIDNNATADGVEENKVRVNLLDAFSNPVANASVEYTVSGLTGVQTSTLIGTSDANGQFELTLTSEKIGTASITATAGGTAITLGSPALVTFVAGAIDFNLSNIEVIDNNATADGVEENKVRVNLVDAFNNPVANASVEYTVSGLTGVQTSTLIGTSDANGQFELTLTSEKIGTASITATAGGTAITLGSPALVTFVAGAIDFNLSNIEVIDNNATADGVEENKVRVNLMDAFSNPVANASVAYTVAGLPEAQPSALTGTSDADGQFELTLTSEKIGTASITATANGTAITLGSPALVTFVAGAIDFRKSNIEVVDNNATADGISKNKVVVNLMDAFSNPVANASVAYTVAGLPEAQPSALTGTSDANGQFELTLTSEKIGTASITATANGTAITLGSPALVTFVAGAIDFRKSNIEVVDNNATADGTSKNKVVVNLMDAFSNPVANASVAYTVAGLPEAQPSALTGTSDANGQFELTLTSEKIGTASITATANGTAITLGSPALVTFVAGAIDFRKSNIEVVDNNATADGISKNKVVVNLMDAFSNPVANASVAYTVAGLPEAQPSALTGTSDANGQFELTLTSEKIGTASITATANGTAITLGSPALVTFVAGAIDFRKSNIEVVDNNATADGISKNKVVVNLMDAFSNPVANASVAYTVAGLPEAQPSALTGTSDADGQFELTLTSEKIGTASITATANGTAITLGSPALVTFVAGAVDYDKSNLKVTKDNAVADGVDYNEFTATIMDAFKNPIANKDVVFNITNPDGTKEQRTITTDAAGQAVIKTTSTKPGTVTVDAQVDAKSINGSPATAKFVIANNLLIAKVADQARVKAGTNTSFTVTITNNGPAKIEAGKVITLGEIPSTGLTITGYAVTSGNAIAAGTGNTATVTTNSEITVGGTIIVKVTATVGADAPSTITNGIKVWGPDKDPGTDPEDDKDDTPEVPVDRESNLSIVKKADQTRVKAGENTTFTLTITNDGPSTIDVGKKIQLTERPGAGVSIDKYEIVGTNATISGTANNAVVTTTAKIAKGQTIVVKVTAKVDADAPSTIANGITVWGPDKDPGTDPEDDTDDTPPVPVDRDYKLTIEKVADESKVKAGESTTFTVTITNNGPSVMEIGKDIKLVERPGAGVSIEKYEIVGSNATISSTANNATVKTTAKLTVGGTIIVKITAKVDDEAPEKITNGISVWGPGKEPGTDPEDDKDDTPEVPVVYPLIQAVDDVAETKTAVAVEIDVLANDIVTKWDINPTSLEVVSSSVGATTTVGIDGKVTYISSRDKIGEDTFTYRVKDIKGRWSNTATVRVAVMNNDLDIPNIITPNGDGKNDEFRINGLELYDRVVLTIVNRWGNEVYKSNKYNNDWSGAGLSEGTYFYVLELVKGGKSEVQKGWVTIKSN